MLGLGTILKLLMLYIIQKIYKPVRYVYLDALEQTDVMVESEPAGTPPTTTIYSDFVIEITKDGYNDYTVEFDNMYMNEKQAIALQEPLYLGAGTEAILSEGSSLDADISSGSGLTAVIE